MPEPVVIIGAGPAGLTAAYQLVKNDRDVVVFEADPDSVGGICRTVEHKGFRFDIGGHRFFSKSKEIENLWDEMLPIEGDMLVRDRSSRILYRKRFFSYPLKPVEALFGLGIGESIRCGFSYLKARFFPNPDPANFEEWVSNQFGSRLFSIFFKTYTEKVWGMPCTEISADWAAQRIKGLNLSRAVIDSFFPQKNGKDGEVVKTLINSFRYPRKGPGMLWKSCAEKVIEKGGVIHRGHCVTRLVFLRDEKRWEITATDLSGEKVTIRARHVISSAAIGDLGKMLGAQMDQNAKQSCASLRYRDFITVAVIVRDGEKFRDQWIYIHDPDVQVGRIQNFKAWSPEMVPDPSMTCYGMEYFCFEQDDGLWAMTDQELGELAKSELVELGLISPDRIEDASVVRQRKAYPVYDDAYSKHVEIIRSELTEKFPGLHLVGRNGMHKYNNQDHSMMTACLCVENILAGKAVYDIWKVNEDADYCESEGESQSTSGLRGVPRKIST